MHVYYQCSVWSENRERASWNGPRSSSSRPRIYIIIVQCGKRIGIIIRELTLVPLYVDHECILRMISVVSDLGARPVKCH